MKPVEIGLGKVFAKVCEVTSDLLIAWGKDIG
jgi:hypothetical protein